MMNKQERLLVNAFALFSALTSFMFVYYAVGVVGSENPSRWLRAFAYVTGGYGLANIYMLSWAWRSQARWTILANKFIAVSFLGVFVMDAINEGISGGMQIVGILGVGFVVALNWYTIRRLCLRDDT